MHVPALSASEVVDLLAPSFDGYEQMPTDARVGDVQALTDGRAAYGLIAHGGMVASDPSALAAGLSHGLNHGATSAASYGLSSPGWRPESILEIRLRTLTLTEISLRLYRTPGSTKDYLSWLEDVDLVTSRQKRYTFSDPLLRLWVRLYCRPTAPSSEEIAREVQTYAFARLPHAEPAPALAYAGVGVTPEERKGWGIIEID
jgi:hypothetical protein